MFKPRLLVRALGFVVAVSALSGPTAVGASAGGFTPVLSSRKVEFSPAAASGWLTWTQAVKGKSDRLLAQPEGGERFTVTPEGTSGIAGNIDGNRLLYDAYIGRKPGDLALYDLTARTHLAPPAGVNTEENEQVGSISGDWVLFARTTIDSSQDETVILRNVATAEEHVLGTGKGERRYAQPGSVAGDFATWFRCVGADRCAVSRYQISTGTMLEMPNPLDRAQFAASVTPDGTVYFFEATSGICGKHVTLWRFTPLGVREKLGQLPRGHDSSKTSPVVSGTSTTIYVDDTDCESKRFDFDISKVTV